MLLCLGSPSAAFAQGAPERARIWVAGGLGGAEIGSGREAVALLFEAAWQKRVHQFTLRGLVASEIGGASEAAVDVGFLYGRGLIRHFGHVSASAGLAYTEVPCGKRPFRPTCRTVGMPVMVEAALRIASVAGIGVQLFGNLNVENSYIGALVFLQLGWLP